MRPIINIEPRWYYNLDVRAAKGSNTNNNAGNFVAVAVNYMPDWFNITNNSGYRTYNELSIIPRWAIRRNIGNSNFNYEAGAGIEHRLRFVMTKNYSSTSYDSYLDVYARIGYAFN